MCRQALARHCFYCHLRSVQISGKIRDHLELCLTAFFYSELLQGNKKYPQQTDQWCHQSCNQKINVLLFFHSLVQPTDSAWRHNANEFASQPLHMQLLRTDVSLWTDSIPNCIKCSFRWTSKSRFLLISPRQICFFFFLIVFAPLWQWNWYK